MKAWMKDFFVASAESFMPLKVYFVYYYGFLMGFL